MDTTRWPSIIAVAILLPLAGCTNRAVEEITAPEAGTSDAEFEYFCPMHPHIAREQSGACPECNMPFSKRTAAIVKLSPDDRRLVEAQGRCPITEDTFGYAGTPVKVVIHGQPVFLCCDGCTERALAKPDETLAAVAKSKSRRSSAGDAESKTLPHKGEAHGRTNHKHDGHGKGAHQHHARGGHHGEEPAPKGAVKVGDKVPDFSVRTLDGKSVKLSELQKDEARTRSEVLVLSFWCTTCHSCRDVEELLAELSKEYEGQAAVFGLTANANESAQDVADFLKKKGLALPTVLDPRGHTADLFGVNRTTTTLVIDANGVLRYCGQFRQKDGGSAEAALKAVLAGKEVAVKTTPHLG